MAQHAGPRPGRGAGARSGADAGGERRPWTPAAVAISAAAFVALAWMAHAQPYLPVDLAFTHAVQTIAPSLGLALVGISWLGYAPQSYLIAGFSSLVLVAAGLRREAGLALFAGTVVAAGNLVKILVRRPRPDPALVDVMKALAPWGFPSGHVVTFTAFGGFLAFLARLRLRSGRARVAVIAAFVVLDALMGLSRIYVGDHWLTDVIGGYLLGGLWLALTIALFHRWVGRPARGATATVLALALATMLLGPARARAAAPAPGGGAAPETVVVITRPASRVATGRDTIAADTVGMDDLRATTAPPWNPPAPIPRRRAWEQAVQMPFRIATLPLSGLGDLTERALLWGEQSGRIPLGPQITARTHHGPTGTVGAPGLGDFAGTGLSLEGRAPVGGGRIASALDVRVAYTTHKYDQVRVGWIGRPFAIQAGHEWRPQDRFYGLGDDASSTTLTSFASETEYARASLRAEWNRRPGGKPRRSVEVWAGPREVVTRTGREHDRVSWDVIFPALAAPTLDRRVDHFVTGARVLLDDRAGAPHWSRGARVLLSAERFDDPVRAFAFSNARDRGARFTRYVAEGEVGTSIRRDPRTLRLRVRLVHDDVQARGGSFLLTDYSVLGGQGGIRGYVPGRFHDRDLALSRLQYVFPVSRRLEMEIHGDLGGVYHQVFDDLTPRSLRHSFGFSLRARSLTSPVAMIGLDVSPEAVRLGFGLGALE